MTNKTGFNRCIVLKDFEKIIEALEELLPLVTDDIPLDDRNLVELELLSNLVADFDDAHFPIKTPTLAKELKLKMYEKDLSQTMLSEIIGVRSSCISEYLTRKSEPTLSFIRILQGYNLQPV